MICQHDTSPTLAIPGSDTRWCPVCGTLIGSDGEVRPNHSTPEIVRAIKEWMAIERRSAGSQRDAYDFVGTAKHGVLDSLQRLLVSLRGGVD